MREFTRRGVLGVVGATGLAGCSALTGGGGGGNGGVSGATKLVSDDVGAEDRFHVVSLSGDGTRLLVGASHDDSNGPRSGAVYAFERTDGTWRQRTRFVPPDGRGQDLFGIALDLSHDGTTALVGAPGPTDSSPDRSGRACVFSADGDEWRRVTTLSPEVAAGGRFGFTVHLTGDGTAAVVGDPAPVTDGAGNATVFSRTGGEWHRTARLTATEPGPDDLFGSRVALSADATTAVCTAVNDDGPNGMNAGAAYAFSRSADEWRRPTRIVASDGDEDDWFGADVALSADGTVAVFGARVDEDPSGRVGGSAYVFERTGEGWRQRSKLVPDDGDASAQFGARVALSADGSTAVITAPGDDANGRRAGAAYVFGRADDGWRQARKLTPGDGDAGDTFGSAISVSAAGETVAVGASSDEATGQDAGAAYVFDLADGG